MTDDERQGLEEQLAAAYAELKSLDEASRSLSKSLLILGAIVPFIWLGHESRLQRELSDCTAAITDSVWPRGP